MKRPCQYGGQAVIEGVMMRGARHYAIAVRKSPEEVIVHEEAFGSISGRHRFFKLPLIRGVVALFESFILGYRSLNFSANQFMEEEGEKELSPLEMTFMMILAFGIAIVFFIALPLGLRNLAGPVVKSVFYQNVLEGIIRLFVLVIYILSVSRIKEIKRVFAYHGAEHKTIFTYEAKEELTVENARNKSTLHPRCGTSFLLFVVVVSAIVFSFLKADTFLIRFAYRILFLPIVAGLSYELIKFSGRHQDFFLWRWMSLPGLWLQKLTTREPDDSMLEVAIAALKRTLELEKSSDEGQAELTA